MNEIIEFIKKTMHIDVQLYETAITKELPNFIMWQYDIKKAKTSDISFFFLITKDGFTNIPSLKKHISLIQEKEDIPIIYVSPKLSFYQRDVLLKNQIPFISEGKVIYLPFLGSFIQNKTDTEPLVMKEFQPLTQLFFIAFLLSKKKNVAVSEIANALGITPSSLTRVISQLSNISLLRIEKRGVNKYLSYDCSSKELFEAALPFLINPVKKFGYVNKAEDDTTLTISSYSALAGYSMLNHHSSISIFASSDLSKWKDKMREHLYDEDYDTAIEIWRYDPSLTAKNGIVDRISLFLSLRGSDDVRVEIALEEMMDTLWRELDG